jgi:hypothetical protein
MRNPANRTDGRDTQWDTQRDIPPISPRVGSGSLMRSMTRAAQKVGSHQMRNPANQTDRWDTQRDIPLIDPRAVSGSLVRSMKAQKAGSSAGLRVRYSATFAPRIPHTFPLAYEVYD